MAEDVTQQVLREQAAFQLANVTKTAPQYGAITPRWLVRLLDWKPLEAGTFRRNRVDEGKAIEVTCGQVEESALPGTYVQYEENPKEYKLSAINALLNVHTRISDLFSKPYDQVGEQLRLMIEHVKERQESELLNNADYGFLHSVPTPQHIKTRTGAPTPDDLDELLTKVWQGALVFPGASARHRRVRARMHAARRAATDRHAVRQPVSNLARPPLDSYGQDSHPQQSEHEQDFAAPRRGTKAGLHRAVPTRLGRRTESRPIGPFHGD